jgi:hypothetical protein
MAPLDEMRSGTRTDLQQRRLIECRDWLARQIEPVLRGLIEYEGFWATGRPGWADRRWLSADQQSLSAARPGQRRRVGGRHL